MIQYKVEYIVIKLKKNSDNKAEIMMAIISKALVFKNC